MGKLPRIFAPTLASCSAAQFRRLHATTRPFAICTTAQVFPGEDAQEDDGPPAAPPTAAEMMTQQPREEEKSAAGAWKQPPFPSYTAFYFAHITCRARLAFSSCVCLRPRRRPSCCIDGTNAACERADLQFWISSYATAQLALTVDA